MVASYFGIGKKASAQNIEEAAQFIPVESIPSGEFKNLLNGFGIPAMQPEKG